MRTWEMGSLFLSNESLELYTSLSFYNWFVLLLSFSLVHTFQARTHIALEIDDWQWSVIKNRLFYDAFKFLNEKIKHIATKPRSTFECPRMKATLLTGPVDLYPVSLSVLYYMFWISCACILFNFELYRAYRHIFHVVQKQYLHKLMLPAWMRCTTRSHKSNANFQFFKDTSHCQWRQRDTHKEREKKCETKMKNTLRQLITSNKLSQ